MIRWREELVDLCKLLYVMICSQKVWAIEYLSGLREKFLSQEYPEALINEQFIGFSSESHLDVLSFVIIVL